MIDQIAYSSKLRTKSPCLKSFFAMMTLIMCVSKRSIFFSIIVLIIMGSLIAYSSKASLHCYLHLALVPVLFVLLSTVTIVVNYSEVPLSLIAIPLWGKYITVSWAGLLQGMTLILTALGAVSCLYFLSLSTPMTDILTVLKTIHCPILISELFLLIYRFIFIILDLAHSIMTAQKCRLSNRNYKTALKAMADMLEVLLIRSLKKSQKLYDAMEARCYDGEIHVLQETGKAGKKEIIAVAAAEIILLGICLLEWW